MEPEPERGGSAPAALDVPCTAELMRDLLTLSALPALRASCAELLQPAAVGASFRMIDQQQSVLHVPAH